MNTPDASRDEQECSRKTLGLYCCTWNVESYQLTEKDYKRICDQLLVRNALDADVLAFAVQESRPEWVESSWTNGMFESVQCRL